MDLRTRFEAKISPEPTSGCWLWTGALCAKGYARIRDGHRNRKASRVSYELNVAPIPHGQQALHRCDNPPCVNPAHLFLGSHTDNVRDMIAKGRQNYVATRGPRPTQSGERNRAAKLTASQVDEIRAAYAAGDVTMPELARRYGVSRPAISKIWRRKSWTFAVPQHPNTEDGPAVSA